MTDADHPDPPSPRAATAEGPPEASPTVDDPAGAGPERRAEAAGAEADAEPSAEADAEPSAETDAEPSAEAGEAPTAEREADDGGPAPSAQPAATEARPAPVAPRVDERVADLPDDPETLVHLDRLGTPQPPWQGAPARVRLFGLPETAAERLVDSGEYEVVDAATPPGDCDLVVVSTRLPRTELSSALSALRDAPVPVIALVHTGGEAAAVEVLRAGGAGVVAEGNEAAIRAHLEGRNHDASLVETFGRQAGQRGRIDALRGRDRTTGLPGPAAYAQRIEELVASGDVPRVGRMRVLHLAAVAERISPEAAAQLRRRLAVAFRQILHRHGVELYALDDADFGVVGPMLSPNRAEEVAAQLAAITETFAPLGNRTLALVLGHAGPEASLDLAPLQDIAKRALEVAALEQRSCTVSAEQLALGVSSTTELETAQRAIAHVERYDPYPEGHGQRCAEWAAEIAWALGVEGQARARVQLAALLHHVGKVSLPPACLSGPKGLDEEHLRAFRTHPDRGAGWLRASAGDEVADAVRHHHERWDGTGYPDGLAGDAIPVAARVVRVVDAFDALLAGVHEELDEPLPKEEALDALAARGGGELDPEIVEVAVPVLDKALSQG